MTIVVGCDIGCTYVINEPRGFPLIDAQANGSSSLVVGLKSPMPILHSEWRIDAIFGVKLSQFVATNLHPLIDLPNRPVVTVAANKPSDFPRTVVMFHHPVDPPTAVTSLSKTFCQRLSATPTESLHASTAQPPVDVGFHNSPLILEVLQLPAVSTKRFSVLFPVGCGVAV